MEQGQTKLSPWLAVWIRPRETVRAQLDTGQPVKWMIPIALGAGILNVLDRASGKSAGDMMSFGALIALILIGGMVGGLISLYLGSALFVWVGRWYGGTGSYSELRTALTLGSFMPTIATGILWIPLLLVYGEENFTYFTPEIDASPVLFSSISFAILALSIWSLVLMLKAVGEAHQFSAWRALGSIVVMGGIALGIIIVIGIITLIIGIIISNPIFSP
ncbi:Yip1 family protein [Paenibacillus sp. NPDC058174]|uniref:Yip1 family protein n=1 Tax=Paenibacillus sp. NPDC058174 TaxID=3346366 RepID=UPI0036D952FC